LKVQVGAELAAERKEDNLHTINIFLHPSSSSGQSASRWDCDNTPCFQAQQIIGMPAPGTGTVTIDFFAFRCQHRGA
jgi:hypothetical protein